MYLVYEDMIEQFSSAALNVIMDAPVFRASGFQSEGITSGLQALEHSGTGVLKGSDDPPLDSRCAAFLQGVIALRETKYELANTCFVMAAKEGLCSPLLHFNLIRSALGLADVPVPKAIEASLQAVEQLRIRKLPSTRGWTLFNRGVVKTARMVLTAHGIDDPIS